MAKRNVGKKETLTYKGKKAGWFTTLRKKKYMITGFTKMAFSSVYDEVKTDWVFVKNRSLPEDIRPYYVIPVEDTLGDEPATFLYDEQSIYKPLTDEQKAFKKEYPKEKIVREYQDDIPEKDRLAWEQYLNLLSEYDSAFYLRLLDEVVNCVIVPIEELQAYRQIKRAQGLKLPNPEKDEVSEYLVRKLFVKENVIFNDEEEWARLLKEAMVIAGAVDEKKADNAFDSFRHQVEKDAKAGAGAGGLKKSDDTGRESGEVEN